MRKTIDVGGRARTMTIVGGTAADRPRDLLLVLHGSRQQGESHRAFTGRMYDGFAADGGAVVAYLDGHRGNWNDARRQSSFPARLDGIDDVGFVRAAIASLVDSHGIDPTRVFVVGYSNGGQMVMRLVHEVPELLAGATVIAATMPAAEDFLAADALAVPMPMLLVHGTSDPIVPFGGGPMKRWAERAFKVGGTALSAPDTAAYFARRNGIAATPTTARRGAGKVWTEQVDHAEPGHAPVRFLAVHGAGHTVPGPKRAPFVIGRTERSWSMADEIGTFFGVRTRAASGTR